jgi:hypothetical protein
MPNDESGNVTIHVIPQVVATQEHSEAARVSESSAEFQVVQGFLTVDKAGEVSVDVNFPVRFIERPSLSFGGELDGNHFPEAGNYPTVSVVVARWTKDLIDTTRDEGFYSGATLMVVTTGKSDQKMIVHWQMSGRAFKNPVRLPQTTDDII